MANRIFDNSEQGSLYVAKEIASLIRKNNRLDKHTVLGFATGNTPIVLYRELVRMHKQEGLSFKKVVTFNLDEYFPMNPDDIHSYHFFMYDNLFSHIDIDHANVHIPKGTLEFDEVEAYCADYDKKIKEVGGLDIQVLGIGRSGHIGFNEPGTSVNEGTHLVNLNQITIQDAAGDFGGIESVPVKAITMGLKTILHARRIFLLAWGKRKADIVGKALQGVVSSELPATFLQNHEQCEFVLDKSASSYLRN